MEIFLLICSIIHLLGLIIKVSVMITAYHENADGLFNYNFYSLPFSLCIFIGLILATIWLW